MNEKTITKVLAFIFSLIVFVACTTIMTFASNSTSSYVSSDTQAVRGDEITFSVGITGGNSVQSILIIPTYDSNVFELTNGGWTLSGSMMSDFSVSTGDGVILFNPGISVNGTVLTFTLKVKNDASFGTYSVSADVVVTDSTGNSTLSTSPATVQVKCNHSYTAQNTDVSYQATPASCTNKATYYYSCTGCGEKGTETFESGSTLPHTFTKKDTSATYLKSAASCTAPAEYYYCCETCTAKGTDTYSNGTVAEHKFTKKEITDAYKASSADCNNAAKYYYCCETCTAKGTETYTNGTSLGHTGGTATCTDKAVCTRCSQPYGSTLPHTYDKTVATDTYLASGASCTAKAKYYHSCSCGAKGTTTFESGSTLPHAFTKKNTNATYLKEAATCQKVAEYYYCCETCTAKGTDTYTNGTVAEHKFTKKEITDAYKASSADCTNAAKYYYCCETCTAKGSDTYTNGTSLGHTGGTATCTVQAVCTRCSQSYGGTLTHSYTNKVTNDSYLYSGASCTSKALYYYSCSCGAKGNSTYEVGSLLNHNFTDKTITDTYLKSAATCTEAAIYYYNCASCGEKGTDTFEHGTAPGHKYGTEWSQDKNNHWHECSVCGDKKDSATHTAGAAATEYTAQTCTVCSYVITPAIGHTHKYETKWSNDGTSHWYACSGCSEVKEKANHTFTNGCDKDCNVCGYERSITHKYITEWKQNDTSHWHQCSECGNKADEAAHIPGAEATETTAQKCTACGYVIKEALGHTHNYGTVWNSDETNHWHTCSCGEVADKAAHVWDAGTETKQATVDTEGEMTYKCTVCDAKKTSPIEKLPAPITPDEPDTPTEPDKPDTPAEPDKPTEPTEPDVTEEKKDSGIILYIIIGVVAAAAVAICIVLVIKKKKA